MAYSTRKHWNQLFITDKERAEIMRSAIIRECMRDKTYTNAEQAEDFEVAMNAAPGAVTLIGSKQTVNHH